MDLRRRLRLHTRAAHERLENHPTMHSYAVGRLTAREYRRVLATLSSFWHTVEPATRELPGNYHILLGRYRLALRTDAASEPRRSAPAVFDEIAYFYLLLGSSHGARMMLYQESDDDLPRGHLRVLSDGGSGLWRPFMADILGHVRPGREEAVLAAAEGLFDTLYVRISSEEWP